MKKITIAVDIPLNLLNQEDENLNNNIKNILLESIDEYFNSLNMFIGINIYFNKDVVYENDKNKIYRFTFNIDEHFYKKLIDIKEHTLLSLKKIAEIIIIKELIKKSKIKDKDYGWYSTIS